jgi:hypothetical protein
MKKITLCNYWIEASGIGIVGLFLIGMAFLDSDLTGSEQVVAFLFGLVCACCGITSMFKEDK